MRIHPDLPLYYIDSQTLPVLYVPGAIAVVKQSERETIEQILRKNTSLEELAQSCTNLKALIARAEKVYDQRQAVLKRPFSPVCLTIYLSNFCNLACTYCFARHSRKAVCGNGAARAPLLKEEVFTVAAKIVAENCSNNDKHFQLVIHGGGEPTLHRDLLYKLVAKSQSIAADYGLRWSGYIATNGVVPLDHVHRLSSIFHRVGLSCDGPPDIHNVQRPAMGGRATFASIRETACIVRNSPAKLEIRATITPNSVDRQKEIVEYLVGELGAETIRFEPVYENGQPGESAAFGPTDAVNFANRYMEALEAALELGVKLEYSGIRLDEIHGSHCNTLKQVLHLRPDGKASACFLCVDDGNSASQRRQIGEFNTQTGLYCLDDYQVVRFQEQMLRAKSECRDCFAEYHCTGTCPDICTVEREPDECVSKVSFRCRLNRNVGELLLKKAASEIFKEKEIAPQSVHPFKVPVQMEATLKAAPPQVAERITRRWQKLPAISTSPEQRMPVPLWKKKGWQFNSEQTWQALQERASYLAGEPISIYIHIPFCPSHCAFCDCYTIACPADHPIQADYIDMLLRDIHHWGSLAGMKKRTVTTVHFGGGTPNSLKGDALFRIVTALEEHFLINDRTELALESTVHLLSEEHLDLLHDAGFRRIHIGVQTLEEPLRHDIGRRETADRVLARVDNCLAHGFVTSVDLLYGLPGESGRGFMAGIDELMVKGVHGISFYRFNESGRNQRFVAQHKKTGDIYHDYTLFMLADYLMEEAGYRKNHFAHYALPEDENLYYTHARRGEDLLAFGASADGIFSGLQYRNPHLSSDSLYKNIVQPVFQGGLLMSKEEREASRAASQVMTAQLSPETFDELGLYEVLQQWDSQELVREDNLRPACYRLTGNGSWCISTMISNIHHALYNSTPKNLKKR